MKENAREGHTSTSNPFFDIKRVINLKDAGGKLPSVLIVTSSRSDGKTFSTLKMLFEEAQEGRKFLWLFRNKYECRDANRAYDDILSNKEGKWERKSVNDGMLYEFLYDGVTIFFSMWINHSRKVKNISGIFYETEWCLLDEYQDEAGEYLDSEVEKVISILVSANRGKGFNSGSMRLILLGNLISPINPWFSYYNISKRLNPKVRKVRGDGWLAVFHHSKNRKSMETGINNVFSDSEYMKHVTSNMRFLSDPRDKILGEKYKGVCQATIYTSKFPVGIWYCSDGRLLLSEKVENCPLKYRTVEYEPRQKEKRRLLYFNRNTKLYRMIEESYKFNDLFFSNEDVLNIFYDEILKNSV